jgi:hypothetical protein
MDFRGNAGCPAVGLALDDEVIITGVCGRRVSALVAGREEPAQGSSGGRDRLGSFGVFGTKAGLVGECMTVVIKYKSVVAENEGGGGEGPIWEREGSTG